MEIIKYLITILLLMIIFVSCSPNNQNEISIIPEPLRIEELGGEFTITEGTKIFSDSKFKNIENITSYLNEYLSRSTGNELTTLKIKPEKDFIHLKFDPKIDIEEGYILESNEKEIIISASRSIGLFYGIQTLLQLLPFQIYSTSQEDFDLTIQSVKIVDEPKFKWRGVHLDVGRHFYSVEAIKNYIDYLAMHKMRQFHWHLTEDQGWRIEIKKYPKLTSVGAWRKETMGDGKRYGGYYTQEQVKEIVQYAQTRFIEVIPEIELPGHSVAALAAYPEFSCTGGPFEVATTWGVHKDVYCAGNENTFKFLEDVFDEVIPLFPSKYIHIGGDECPKDRWKKCAKCQQRIIKAGLKDEHELQSYFIQRIEKYLLSKNRRIIGWDEILEGGLAPQATVMSWRGIQGGIDAAKQGHDVIMTPGSHCYFDHHQGDPAFEPHAFGGRLTLTKVYSYEPIPNELNQDESEFILGAQANVWTERLPEFKDVEYMLIPRLAAISEVVWSPKEKKSHNNFMRKMETQIARYENLGINYAKSAYNATINTVFNDTTNTLDINMSSEIANTDIYFTRDGRTPNNNSEIYDEPLKINESTVIRAVSYKNDKLMSKVTEKKIVTHKAFGKKIEILNPYESKYSSDETYSVVNGLFGTNSFQDSYWQGYEEVDFEVIIDLGQLTEISLIETGFIQDNHSWIFLPKYVEYSFSHSAKDFSNTIRIENDIDPKVGESIVKRFSHILDDKKTRYIKVLAKNIEKCPDWHQGAGGKAWLFVDEIKID